MPITFKDILKISGIDFYRYEEYKAREDTGYPDYKLIRESHYIYYPDSSEVSCGDISNRYPTNLKLDTLEHISSKTLCLGHEWFDKDNDQYSRKIPYRVFRVSDDTEVV